ncbi:hypothetical protein IQ238_15560 [Pleurocapsales cyanobacterium LEGE 06147]|nr:hypothetical protein [Pleurocapsales cyanobacterium LEGE 06147]
MNDEGKLPNSFAEMAKLVENFALQEIRRETKQKQLYYHTVAHAYGVKRRANLIFQALKPIFESSIEPVELSRLNSLINICAVTHDMVQEFIPPDQLYAPRKRPVGISEAATITKLINYIEKLNQKYSQAGIKSSAIFTNADIQIIKEAIKVTICIYGNNSNCIYQPHLYHEREKLSITARIIALADLGTLGIEGVNAYLREGVLVFLEENPDVARMLLAHKNIFSQNNLNLIQNKELILDKNLRERLLRSARFMVNFAKERKKRFPEEIAGFTTNGRYILKHQIFKYLNSKTIEEIEKLTPTNKNTSLNTLLNFFKFNKYI